MFYGQQQALQAGTSISIEEPAAARNLTTDDDIADYRTCQVDYFRNPGPPSK